MKDDRIYLLHVRDAIQHIVSYTATGKESFFSDRKTQDAVVTEPRNCRGGDQARIRHAERSSLRHSVETPSPA